MPGEPETGKPPCAVSSTLGARTTEPRCQRQAVFMGVGVIHRRWCEAEAGRGTANDKEAMSTFWSALLADRKARRDELRAAGPVLVEA
jgi:hypothetical protein